MISLVFYDYRSFIGLKFVVGLTLADCKASRRIFGLLSEINYGGSWFSYGKKNKLVVLSWEPVPLSSF